MTEEHPDPSDATREWINLKFAAFRSEVRLLFVLSVAGNQVLAHLSITPLAGYIGAGGILVLGGIKLIMVGR